MVLGVKVQSGHLGLLVGREQEGGRGCGGASGFSLGCTSVTVLVSLVNWACEYLTEYLWFMHFFLCECVRAQSFQLCLTLCDPMDRLKLTWSSVHGIFQARIREWVSNALLQGSFPTQELDPHLLPSLHCRWILYLLGHLSSVAIFSR